MEHEVYMRQALGIAKKAAAENEVPVGCVIVDASGLVIGTGRNRCEAEHSAVAHAEIEAIQNASISYGGWRLNGCTLYVTLEPCPMCAGAIINSRIDNVVYGAKDPNTGSCGSVINLFMEQYGHKPAVIGGVLEEECAALMTDFFDKLRNQGA